MIDIISNKKGKMIYLSLFEKALKKTFWQIFLFSAFINLMTLVMPIYSMQVFDRVMSSASIETLLALTILAVFVYVLYGVLNGVRELMLVRLSGWMEKRVSEKLFKLCINHSSLTGQKVGPSTFADANVIKTFITSPAVFSFFDIPWSFLFIFIIYLISPQLALLVLFGAAVLFALTYFKEVKTKPYIKQNNEMLTDNNRRLEEFVRNSETIEAMGMMKSSFNIWSETQGILSEKIQENSKLSIMLTSLSKSLRMLLQIIILGYGTYLALNKEMTMGGILAISILSGKALAPFDALMSMWGGLSNIKESFTNIKTFLGGVMERPESMNLNSPDGVIELEGVNFGRSGPLPGSIIPIIKNVSMKINPGEVVGVIGPSASGKSTLVKLICGIYRPQNGVVKLDGGDIFMRNREDVGPYIGYLSQTIDLMKGTIKQNIARFDPEAKDEDIINAAKATGVHELVLSFADGYDTVIGDGVVELSGGQKQRVALARAFYKLPKIIVLDEPNANLDEVGERMLLHAMVYAKKMGSTLIIISHKPAIINLTDKVCVIKSGELTDFGITNEVILKYAKISANQQSYKDVKQELSQAGNEVPDNSVKDDVEVHNQAERIVKRKEETDAEKARLEQEVEQEVAEEKKKKSQNQSEMKLEEDK